MTVPIKVFSNTQTSASPIPMAGTAGYLDAILYACLVTGFNPKTISGLTVTANVATVTTSTTHGYTANDIIAISGANESVFNDSFTITSIPATNQFTFAVTTATTPATGSPTCCIAPLGWTRSYTGTNKSVYRSNDITGTQLYLRVDDTNAQYAIVNIYETMSSVDTGTGVSPNVYWRKSSTANTVARDWQLVGDSKRFWLMTRYLAGSEAESLSLFGDIIPWKSSDAYHCALGGFTTSNPSEEPYSSSGMTGTYQAGTGMYLARSYSQIGGAVGFIWHMITASSNYGFGVSYAQNFSAPFPAPADNSLHLFPVYVRETSSVPSIRGVAPGLYVPFEVTAGAFATKDRSIVTGGRTYMAFKPGYTYNYRKLLDRHYRSLDIRRKKQ